MGFHLLLFCCCSISANNGNSAGFLLARCCFQNKGYTSQPAMSKHFCCRCVFLTFLSDFLTLSASSLNAALPELAVLTNGKGV